MGFQNEKHLTIYTKYLEEISKFLIVVENKEICCFNYWIFYIDFFNIPSYFHDTIIQGTVKQSDD